MGHISEAWTNLALSRRELHDEPSDGIVTATIFRALPAFACPT
jgi:hypothetical protein